MVAWRRALARALAVTYCVMTLCSVRVRVVKITLVLSVRPYVVDASTTVLVTLVVTSTNRLAVETTWHVVEVTVVWLGTKKDVVAPRLIHSVTAGAVTIAGSVQIVLVIVDVWKSTKVVVLVAMDDTILLKVDELVLEVVVLVEELRVKVVN
jgi:hypothetical protein